MTRIDSITLEGPDPAGASAFYVALGLGERVHARSSSEPATGFRGFTLSLLVSQPGNVDLLTGAALDLGATAIKPVAKSFWGYGGVVEAPDGAILKIATSSKKDAGPAERTIDDLVLLLGASDVKASKSFYVEQGFAVKRSFGGRYAEFEGAGSSIKLALYGRRALAKDAGVSPDGGGAHRILLGSDAGTFTDPDGFAWEPAIGARRAAPAASAVPQVV